MLTKKQTTDIRARIGADTTGFPLVFQALGDPGRFNIIRLLMHYQDICVTDIANVFDITVSAASQQLRVLERLGLVIKIRMGQMVCYALKRDNPTVKQLIQFLKST